MTKRIVPAYEVGGIKVPESRITMCCHCPIFDGRQRWCTDLDQYIVAYSPIPSDCPLEKVDGGQRC